MSGALPAPQVTALPQGYGPADVARLVAEPRKRPGRGHFARDRARVLHSSALRRLGGKTQVVDPGTDDFSRTRLTHSLEVAQVGRELAASLGCAPDVVETACLAHDLGHPPFGHNGERALAEEMADAGGFEGNAQTLRLLTRLEPKISAGDGSPAGLNLTRACLDAATKYPWRRGDGPGGTAKFGVYASDEAAFAWLRQGAPVGVPCLEAQVMDLADDVAYSVHDVEDAVVAGRLDPRDLTAAGVRERVAAAAAVYLPDVEPDEALAALDRLRATPSWVAGYDGGRRGLAALKTMTSQLIGRFCSAAEQATRAAAEPDAALTRYAARVRVPRGTLAEIAALKAVASVTVMQAADRAPLQQRQRDVVVDLLHLLGAGAPESLEPPLAADWRDAADDTGRLRAVADQVASLTDVRALERHAQLLGRDRPTSLGGT